MRQKVPRLLPAPGVSLASVQTRVTEEKPGPGRDGPSGSHQGLRPEEPELPGNLSFRPLGGGAAASPDTEPTWLPGGSTGRCGPTTMLRNTLPRTRWEGAWLGAWTPWSDSGVQRGGSPCPGRASAGGTGRLPPPDGFLSSQPSPAPGQVSSGAARLRPACPPPAGRRVWEPQARGWPHGGMVRGCLGRFCSSLMGHTWAGQPHAELLGVPLQPGFSLPPPMVPLPPGAAPRDSGCAEGELAGAQARGQRRRRSHPRAGGLGLPGAGQQPA